MMKKHLITLGFLISTMMINAQNATEIVTRAEKKMRGESSIGEMEMKIVRPTWERTISFKTWTRGNDFSLTLVTAPAKEEGQTFLKRQNELWQYDPTINRMIKLPPSMMSQGWMGSDFSNDDVLKEYTLSSDYDHRLLSQEALNGNQTYKIELIPKQNAAVVWGKIIKWISTDEYLQLKSEYYDEDDYLIKTETASHIQTMDGRVIPTHFEIIPAEEEGNKTIMVIQTMQFNMDITSGFFSQQNMKQISRR